MDEKKLKKMKGLGDLDNSDCYELDPIHFIPKDSLINHLDDIVVIAQRGPVALKDYPHPRHLCGSFPFNETPHQTHCSNCYCYVCEVKAPCLLWEGVDSHCNVSKAHKEDTAYDSIKK